MMVEIFREGTRIFKGDLPTRENVDVHSWVLNQAGPALYRQGKYLEDGDEIILEDGTIWERNINGYEQKEQE